MKSHILSNYWISTETYEALKLYMDMDFDGLKSDIVKLIGGESVHVNTFSFQNDMCNFRTKDDVLTLLIHLGYLGYDAEKENVFIPNKEIIGEFENAMSTGGWPEVMRVCRHCVSAPAFFRKTCTCGRTEIWQIRRCCHTAD